MTSAGICCLYARLQPENREAAAMSLACSIAERRLPKRRLPNNKHFESWHQRATGEVDETIGETEALVLQAAVLENVGTTGYPRNRSAFSWSRRRSDMARRDGGRGCRSWNPHQSRGP